jgi:hypothetical protein
VPLIACPACHHVFDDTQGDTCPNCGASVRPSPPPDPSLPAPPAGAGSGDAGASSPSPGSSVPFEDPSLPFLTRLLNTVALAFSNPVRLFSNLPADDIGAPVLYQVIIGTLAVWLGLFWQVLIGGAFGLAGEFPPEAFVLNAGVRFVFAVFAPVFVVVGLFISSGIFHLMLLLFGDGARGFGVTIRAVAYGGTPALLGVVPFCGGIIGGVWGMVLQILGASYGHPTEGWRATLAFLMPAIFCCGMFFFMALLFGMTTAALRG